MSRATSASAPTSATAAPTSRPPSTRCRRTACSVLAVLVGLRHRAGRRGARPARRSSTRACGSRPRSGPRRCSTRARRWSATLGRVAGGVRHGPRPIDVDVLLLGDGGLHVRAAALPHRELAKPALRARAAARARPGAAPARRHLAGGGARGARGAGGAPRRAAARGARLSSGPRFWSRFRGVRVRVGPVVRAYWSSGSPPGPRRRPTASAVKAAGCSAPGDRGRGVRRRARRHRSRHDPAWPHQRGGPVRRCHGPARAGRRPRRGQHPPAHRDVGRDAAAARSRQQRARARRSTAAPPRRRCRSTTAPPRRARSCDGRVRVRGGSAQLASVLIDSPSPALEASARRGARAWSSSTSPCAAPAPPV